MEIFRKTYDVYVERSKHELDVVMTALDAVCDQTDEILSKVKNPKVIKNIIYFLLKNTFIF